MSRLNQVLSPPPLAEVAEDYGRNGRAVQSGPIAYRVYADFEAVREKEAAWDDLVYRVGGDLFQTFAWCEVWWRHFGAGRALELHVASMGEELIAVLPLFRETIGPKPFAVRGVKLVGCDHSNTTCMPAVLPEYTSTVAREMLRALDQTGPWDVLYFGELPGYFSAAVEFAKALRTECGSRDVRFDPDFHPQMIFDLPSSFEAYLATLPRKERRNVRHDERELAKSGAFSYRTPGSREELALAFDRLIELHAVQWRPRGWIGHFGDFPGIEAFHRDAAEQLRRRGRLLFIEACTGDQPIASEYCVRLRDRIHWIIGGRTGNTPSRVGVCGIVRAAVAVGARQIDALNGYYDYKRRLGAYMVSMQTILVGPASWQGRVRLGVIRGLAWLSFQLYFRIWYWHVAPWIRRRWPRSHRLGSLRAALSPRFLRARFLVSSGKVSAESLRAGPAGEEDCDAATD